MCRHTPRASYRAIQGQKDCRVCASSEGLSGRGVETTRNNMIANSSFAHRQCRQSASGGSIFGSYLAAMAYNEDFATLSGRTRQNIMAQNLAREDSAVIPSCVFAGVGGY